MIRRIALASILTIAGAAAFSPIAHAGEATVNFTGNVAKECIVKGPATAQNLESNKNEDGLAIKLYNGTSSVIATCNSAATASIAPITSLGGSGTLAANDLTASATFNGTNTVPVAQGETATIPFQLNLERTGTNKILPAGDYTASVTVTVSPDTLTAAK